MKMKLKKFKCIKCKSETLPFGEPIFEFMGIFFKSYWYECVNCGKRFPGMKEIIPKSRVKEKGR